MGWHTSHLGLKEAHPDKSSVLLVPLSKTALSPPCDDFLIPSFFTENLIMKCLA